MEQIFDKFNNLVNEMADAVALAKTLEEANKIQAEYDIKIEAAEKVLESELEAFNKEQEEILLKEHKASEQELIDKDEDILPIDYKSLYPNKSSINKLKEVDVVNLGLTLELNVNIDLKAKENKEIVINYFIKNIWN